MKTKSIPIRIKSRPIPKGTFLVGDILYPFSQLEDVMRAQLGGTALPTPLQRSGFIKADQHKGQKS